MRPKGESRIRTIRFDSIVSIAARRTFPALFCNPIYGSVRGKYSAASSANNAISGRDSSLWEKTNKPRSNSLSWITLFDPFRLFFHQTSPSVYPFSTLFVLSLSLSFSLRPIAENRIELLSVDDQFSVGEFSYKRYKEFRIRFFRNCRFGECNACLDTSMDVRLEDCNSKWLKIWLIYQRRGSTRIIF